MYVLSTYYVFKYKVSTISVLIGYVLPTTLPYLGATLTICDDLSKVASMKESMVVYFELDGVLFLYSR